MSLSAEENKVLEAVLHFARKVEPGPKGFRKVNVADIQNDSMREIGALIKADDVNPLIEKKLISEKIMEEGGVFINVSLDELEKPCQYWKLVHDLKKVLK